MEQQIIAFVGVLRARGLPISVAETRDAVESLTYIPLAERAACQSALAATLVKDARDRPLFDALFETFFRPLSQQAAHADASHGHHHHAARATPPDLRFAPDLRAASDAEPAGHDHSPASDLRRHFEDAALVQREEPHGGDGERLRLSLMAAHMLITEEGPLRVRLERLANELALRRVHGAWSTGELVGLPARVAERDLTLRAIQQLHDSLSEDGLLRAHIATAAEEIAALASELVRDYLERELARAAPPLTLQPLPDLPWDALARDEPALDAAVRRLARTFDGAFGAPGAARRGRLDPARTVRGSMATGGVPFRVAWRGRALNQPRVVLLCDVSLSVRNAARFMLRLSRHMQRAPGAMRAFVYVREIAEVTRQLSERPFEEVCRRVFSGQLLDADETSDFGAALAAFESEHARAITRRTTLLILGDGRNNGAPPRAELLTQLAARARRIVWLVPEDAATWHSPGSDLPAYAPHCALLAPAPADLERVATRLRG